MRSRRPVDSPVLGRRRPTSAMDLDCPGPAFGKSGSAGLGVLVRVGRIRRGGIHVEAPRSSVDLGEDIAWLKSLTGLPLIVKGIIRGDDAIRAIESGGKRDRSSSNHGGRQLDTSQVTIRALPESPKRSPDAALFCLMVGCAGTDVSKLSRGAQAVRLGRPPLWGLAVGGRDGVRQVLDIIRHELDAALALCGCKSIGKIARDLVRIRR